MSKGVIKLHVESMDHQCGGLYIGVEIALTLAVIMDGLAKVMDIK